MREYLFFVFILFLSFGLVGAGVDGDADAGLAVPYDGFDGNGFKVDSLLLKVSVFEGESFSRNLKITSVDGGEAFFEVVGLQGVSLSEESLVLFKGESDDLEVTFNSSGLEKGVYVGSVAVFGVEERIVIPVVFEVESRDVFFDVNLEIPPAYSRIEPGERVVANLKVFDLVSGGTTEGLGAQSVEFEYYVYSTLGDLLIFEKETSVVDGETGFSKTINFPDNTPEGDYVLVVLVKYLSSVGISSKLFSVVEENVDVGFLDTGIDLNLIFILAVLVIVVFLFIYLVKDRNRFLLELKDYNRWERDKQRGVLRDKVSRSRAKGVSAAEIRRRVKKQVSILKERQKKRNVEFDKLNRKGDLKAMEKKLDGWKKQGFKTYGLERKVRESKHKK